MHVLTTTTFYGNPGGSTLPRRNPRKPTNAVQPMLPPKSPSKSLNRSSSFCCNSNSSVNRKEFKTPLPPPPPLASSSYFVSSATPTKKSRFSWKSKSISDLKGPPPPPLPPPSSTFAPKRSNRPTTNGGTFSSLDRCVSHESLIPTSNAAASSRVLPPPQSTASILNKNLRSNSWRNLLAASSNVNCNLFIYFFRSDPFNKQLQRLLCD